MANGSSVLTGFISAFRENRLIDEELTFRSARHGWRRRPSQSHCCCCSLISDLIRRKLLRLPSKSIRLFSSSVNDSSISATVGRQLCDVVVEDPAVIIRPELMTLRNDSLNFFQLKLGRIDVGGTMPLVFQ